MIFLEDSNEADHMMNEINMIPLIDIMLVLLVVFMITAPMITQSLKVDLPQATTENAQEILKPLVLTINTSGDMALDDQPISWEKLEEHFAAMANRSPQQNLHLQADKNTDYKYVMQVLALANSVELKSLGFIFEPDSQKSQD